MSFLPNELTDIRRHCGYPAYGSGPAGFQGWRFFQAYGLLEFRLQNLAPAEESVLRTYLAQLASLESDLAGTAQRLDTETAAVWTRNPAELAERTQLFDGWRRRLCGFLGIPPGPALGDGSLTLVV